MGLVAGSREHAKLHTKPVVSTAPGDGRGKADRTDRNLRGIPVIGHGSGAIARSAPGGEVSFTRIHVDRVLDAATRLVVRERIAAARIELRFKA